MPMPTEADHSDAAKQNTIVVLADKPIDAASVTDALDREDALREQLRNAKASYVTVTIMEGDDSPCRRIFCQFVSGQGD